MHAAFHSYFLSSRYSPRRSWLSAAWLIFNFRTLITEFEISFVSLWFFPFSAKISKNNSVSIYVIWIFTFISACYVLKSPFFPSEPEFRKYIRNFRSPLTSPYFFHGHEKQTVTFYIHPHNFVESHFRTWYNLNRYFFTFLFKPWQSDFFIRSPLYF